jgi:hypothetical protein
MKTAFVIIDPWKYCEDEDVKQFPDLLSQCFAFSHYLKSMIPELERYADIFVDGSGREISDWFQGINSCDLQDLKHKKILLGGFHFGRCIHNKAKKVLDKSVGIVNNLSIVFPADKMQSFHREMKKFDNYYFTPAGGFEEIECISMKM